MYTKQLESFFHLEKNGTDIKTEVLAGTSTFLMMAYIIVVNPGILAQAGMPFSGVLFATVLVSAISSIAMGLFAGLPYAIAPGMGINAFFTYSMVVTMGISWQTALGATFIAGIFFLLISVTSLRTEIVRAIPRSLRYGLASGIGLFLALIGFKSVHFVVSNTDTVVAFGGLNITTALFFIGLIITSVLLIKKIPGSLIIGIAVTSMLALLISVAGMRLGWLEQPMVRWPEKIFSRPGLDVFLQLDIPAALSAGMILPIFSLVFVDLFDSIASFVGIAEAADMIDEDGTPVHIGPALAVDAFSTTISGLLGTSAGTVYVESAAGIQEGGRTGLTAVVTGLLFLPFMFLSPLIAFIPAVATAPVLVLVGVFMAAPLKEIEWENLEESVPAFLAAILIPLTFSINQGVIWGFLSYTCIKILTGRAGAVHWIIYAVDTLCILALVLPFFA